MWSIVSYRRLIRNGRVPTPGIGIVGDDETLAARLGIEGVVVVRTVPGPADRAGLRGVIAATGEIGDLLAEQPEQHRQTVGAENQRQDTAGFPWATRLPH
jgi:hypothetical protein